MTGGIGSGKTTALEFFRELGRTVFSADDIARNLLENDKDIRSKISKIFGAEAFASGKPDRALLAQIAFGDPRKLRALNAIIHPSVLLTLRAAIAKLPRKKRYPYVVVEAALIFEALLEREFDCIILIETPLNLRLRRTQRFTREDLRRRSRLQLGAREKRKKSHFIISNSGSVQELRDLVGFLDLLLQISPEKPVFTNL